MERILSITVNGEVMLVPFGTKLCDIAAQCTRLPAHPVLIARVNREMRELHHTVVEDCDVTLLDFTSPNGFRVYQRGVVFLLIYAAKEILGRKTRVVVEHSINKNYYCEILEDGVAVTEALLAEMEAKMREIVSQKLPIEKFTLPIETGVRIAEEFGLLDKVKMLKYRRTSSVNFYRLDWFYDYFYGPMPPNSACLPMFKLVPEGKGLMLQFPSPAQPNDLLETKNVKKISKVFNESNKWAALMGTDTVGALNDLICTGHRGGVIRINEALHEKRMAHIADKIHMQNKRVVMIAGPSSSGKTTFAERLCIQLRVNGLNPHVISLDNYYVNREDTPRDEHGKYDFEALEAIDIAQFSADLLALLGGEEVHLPHFNFMSGKREYKGRLLRLTMNSVLVIEGIHGLNEKLSAAIPKEQKFKIFISAMTQLNLDDHNRIPTTDTRMIRRMVRDSQFRGFDAQRTIEMWPSVMRGEEKNIFPFQEDADAIFNSALVYELCVLKQYAEPLLFAIGKDTPEYTEARRLVKFLDCFIGIPAEEVPNNSIIREFIGGSCFRT